MFQGKRSRHGLTLEPVKEGKKGEMAAKGTIDQ